MGLRRWLGLRSDPRPLPKPFVPMPPPSPDYWSKRADLVYLQQVRLLATRIAADASSVIDVGSNGCPHLDWFTSAVSRVSIDLEIPYRAGGVRSIVGDFLTFTPDEHFDLCLCLQVLEHVPDAEPFARKLLKTARHVIVSVPFKWPAGSCEWHIHDPVDEAKMRMWFGREPDQSIIAQEARRTRKSRRLICYYRA